MPFGLIAVDENGQTWIVDVVRSAETGHPNGLCFARPSFIDPVELRFTGSVPECWPNCSADVLRATLSQAVAR